MSHPLAHPRELRACPIPSFLSPILSSSLIKTDTSGEPGWQRNTATSVAVQFQSTESLPLSVSRLACRLPQAASLLSCMHGRAGGLRQGPCVGGQVANQSGAVLASTPPRMACAG